MSSIIKGPRPHVYLDSTIVNMFRSAVYGRGDWTAKRAARMFTAGHLARWTLVTGDTIMKEVRGRTGTRSPRAAPLVANANKILARLPVLRQSDGEGGGRGGMRAGSPYIHFETFIKQAEGHLGAHPRDAKILSDAFYNQVDFVLSLDKKFRVAWGRASKAYEPRLRELVEMAGATWRDIRVVSPAEFLKMHEG